MLMHYYILFHKLLLLALVVLILGSLSMILSIILTYYYHTVQRKKREKDNNACKIYILILYSKKIYGNIIGMMEKTVDVNCSSVEDIISRTRERVTSLTKASAPQ